MSSSPGKPRQGGPLLLKGGRVWVEGGPVRADVRVEGGRIAAVGEGLGCPPGGEVLDVSSLDVLPAFADLHVHAGDRIGRFELADSWGSASQVAVATGITTLFGFATQAPGETLSETLKRCQRRAEGALCQVCFHLTPTTWPWDWEEVAATVAQGVRTFKLYTTYREAGLYTPYRRFAVVMRRLVRLGGRLLVHCEDEGVLAAAATGAVDPSDPFSHTWRRPAAVEVEGIRRIVALARETGCPTHVVHVSTAAGVRLVAAARASGAPVTCETAPHYLLLDQERLRGAGGHRFLCTPPLRDEATRHELEQLAAAGAVDLFATDHCAFSRQDKDAGGELAAVPQGLPGLGGLVPLSYELFVVRHRWTLGELAEKLAAAPARLAGLYPRKGCIRAGADADLVVLTTSPTPRPVRTTVADSYDPFAGWSSTLDVRWVLRGGVVVGGSAAGGAFHG